MRKRTLAALMTVIMLFSLASCFDGTPAKSPDALETDGNLTIYDNTEEYEHMFYGITGSADGNGLFYGNNIIITPISGTDGELDYDEIYVKSTLLNGEQIDRISFGTRVCVKYNGDIGTGEKAMISETVSVVPAAIPTTFGNTLFNIGLIKEYFSFEKGYHNNALNADKVPADGKRNLPVYLANNEKELGDYFFGNINNRVWDGEGNPIAVESVYGYLNGYSKEFFKNKSLILVFISWNTGSADFDITDIERSNGAINISVKNLYSGMTCDTGDWIFIVEVDKEYLRGVTDFNASIDSLY